MSFPSEIFFLASLSFSLFNFFFITSLRHKLAVAILGVGYNSCWIKLAKHISYSMLVLLFIFSWLFCSLRWLKVLLSLIFTNALDFLCWRIYLFIWINPWSNLTKIMVFIWGSFKFTLNGFSGLLTDELVSFFWASLNWTRYPRAFERIFQMVWIGTDVANSTVCCRSTNPWFNVIPFNRILIYLHQVSAVRCSVEWENLDINFYFS